jgi:hypothetical protein
MSLLHDLDDYKLETTFEHNPDCVIHTSYKSDRARGIRKVAVVKRWAPQKPGLGAGTFGTVRLENLLDIQDHDTTSCKAAVQATNVEDEYRLQEGVDCFEQILEVESTGWDPIRYITDEI